MCNPVKQSSALVFEDISNSNESIDTNENVDTQIKNVKEPHNSSSKDIINETLILPSAKLSPSDGQNSLESKTSYDSSNHDLD